MIRISCIEPTEPGRHFEYVTNVGAPSHDAVMLELFKTGAMQVDKNDVLWIRTDGCASVRRVYKIQLLRWTDMCA